MASIERKRGVKYFKLEKIWNIMIKKWVEMEIAQIFGFDNLLALRSISHEDLFLKTSYIIILILAPHYSALPRTNQASIWGWNINIYSFVPWFLQYQNKIPWSYRFFMKSFPLPLMCSIKFNLCILKVFTNIVYSLHQETHETISISNKRFEKDYPFIQCDVT